MPQAAPFFLFPHGPHVAVLAKMIFTRVILAALYSVLNFAIALPQVSTISDGQPQASVSVTLAPSATSLPQVSVKNGTVEGFHVAAYSQDLFLGIPYAQPPTGPLRYTVPQSLNQSYSSPLEAKAYYPECVGYGGDDIGYEVSEDCLALNVIRPAGYEGQELPVAVWIHGGGLQMGGTADRRYNLSFIVQNSVEIGKPIIGVSIGYRLASWGFLYSQEVQGSGNTNLGLRDQRLALHWIQENIAAFGGDPAKVRPCNPVSVQLLTSSRSQSGVKVQGLTVSALTWSPTAAVTTSFFAQESWNPATL